ncbi:MULTISPECIES: helix-turn-helix domain-containing protein [Exiguobacterium]|uniref:PucR family transcriptional regulator n=2 Tax=Exiguobacterium TaxID=33986 RepID=A0A653I6K5_9BACL|nr:MULTISPECIES: helix-turn-helix domain-containing protein [Exiguobacterium]ASI36650.1 PucR family transcriptional regulator [Exiguobacterium sp. N4-1P]VWX34477.1 PucR family transcriptional regulator [Exiguobacterium oxidotolerans]
MLEATYHSLDDLAEAIGLALNAPITIEDRNHRLLAYSTHTTDTDPARVATIIGRRVPESVIDQLWKDEVIQSLAAQDDPLVITARTSVGLNDRVAIAIKQDMEILGYIWSIARNTPFTASELGDLKKGAMLAQRQLLAIDMQKKRQEEQTEQFFFELLHEELPESEILKTFSKLHLAPPGISRLMVIRFPEAITPRLADRLRYLLTIQQTVRPLLYAYDTTDFILWISTNDRDIQHERIQFDAFIQSFRQLLAERFSYTEFVVSSSEVFTGVQSIPERYEEAGIVLRLKDAYPFELQNVTRYERLGLFQLLPIFSERLRRRTVRLEEIERLRAYDLKHTASLCETLEWFLHYDGNVKQVAAHLHVHPNTILYRMRRIEEEAGIRMESLPERSLLYLYLKADRYLL